MTGLKFFKCVLAVFLAVCLLLGGLTAVVDPLFHYHAPLKGLVYNLSDERYMNDGIVRHFDYDAVITGTSLTENFKASDFDRLFGTKSVKVPMMGASFKDINRLTEAALSSGNDVRCVLRCLDYDCILDPASLQGYEDYPEYLYDGNVFNDVKYLLNKEILLKFTLNTILPGDTSDWRTDFDSYARWSESCSYGRDVLDSLYVRPALSPETVPLSEEDIENIRENIYLNVVKTAEDHPNVTYYYFFPPFSIYYWDKLSRQGTLERQLDAEKLVLEMILPCENIRMYSFLDCTDTVLDLDNYKDTVHYGGWINDAILLDIKNGEHLLTMENYTDYLDFERAFYASFDYDSLFDSGT